MKNWTTNLVSKMVKLRGAGSCNRLVGSIVMLCLFTTALAGCGLLNKDKQTQQESKSPTEQNSSNGKAQEEPKQPVLQDPAINPLTGLLVEKANLARRPLAVMVENALPARPQSGLAQADLIYEVLAEGSITRFMAIYYAGDASSVGPIRSARPYFLARSQEYAAIYVHAGGSAEALAQLKSSKIADLDQFRNNYPFRRAKDRKAPHNLYGDTLKMREVAVKKWPKQQEVPAFAFLEKGQQNPAGVAALVAIINYATKVSEVKYVFNAGEGLYYRFNGGREHKDAVSGKQYTASNIIVQFTGSKVIDTEGRRQIEMVGKGKGVLFTGGQRYDLQWTKAGKSSTTSFSLNNGQEMLLNPGQTWIQVVPLGTKITSE